MVSGWTVSRGLHCRTLRTLKLVGKSAHVGGGAEGGRREEGRGWVGGKAAGKLLSKNS